MKKNQSKKEKKTTPKRQKPSDRTREVLNPNSQGSAIRRENQAARVASSRQVLVLGGNLRNVNPARRAIKEEKRGKKNSKLLAWASLVSNPFVGVNSVKCPLNFNPAPSYLSFRTTLVDTLSTTLKVSAGYCRQLFIFPGHNDLAVPGAVVGTTGISKSSDLDEVSFHARFQTIAGVNYAVGPANSYGGALAPRIAISQHISVDGATVAGSVVATSAAGQGGAWDNPLPLTADPTVPGHMRWKMIAMGIRIRNVSTVESRGGTIVTVQPATVVSMASYATQANFDVHPSFRIWGDGTDEVEVTWIPRTRDLAYWHMSLSTPAVGSDLASTELVGPAIVVFLNATATTDQYYSYELYAHFEVSGTNVQVFSGQTHSMTISPAPVQQALSAHINSSPTAHGIQHTVGAAIGEKASEMGEGITRGLSDVAKSGFKAAVQAVKDSI